MPIIKSAKKRVRVSARANERNKITKAGLRNAVKNFTASLKSGKNVADAHSQVQSELDKAVKKGIMHKNKAARKKAQLAKAVSASGRSAKAAPKAKAPAKKATTKAVPAKKVVAKKPAAKKPAAKKPAAKK